MRVHMKIRLKKIARFISTRLLSDDRAAELIELAASLPLLVVFMVGIYDFSSAFIMKQKIAHVAAEAARVAASQPTSDLSNEAGCNAPGSICAIRNIVHSALTNNGINDCGLGFADAALISNLQWRFTASSGCSGQLALTIWRGDTYSVTLPSPPFQTPYMIEATSVTLSYPYQWQFSRVIGLIAPGANYTNSPIQSVAVMQNLN